MVNRAADAPSIRRTLLGLRKYRHLLRNLVLKDLKLKYRGSVVGFLWSLANPLVMAVVYTVAFTKILNAGSEGFVFYLMLGLLAWTYFASSAGDVDRIDRRQRRAGQERLVPARDPADRDGPLQPRAVHRSPCWCSCH